MLLKEEKDFDHVKHGTQFTRTLNYGTQFSVTED